MSSWRTRTAIVLGVLAAAGLSTATTAYLAYQVGGRIGYLDGYFAATLDHEMTGGASLVRALEAMRAGDLEGATALLEGDVDGAVLIYSHSADVDVSRFDPSARSGIQTDRVFSVIAKYRRKHPSAFPDESVRERITSTVEQAPEFVGKCKGPELEKPSSEPVEVVDGEGRTVARR